MTPEGALTTVYGMWGTNTTNKRLFAFLGLYINKKTELRSFGTTYIQEIVLNLHFKILRT
jgi:hypothetical protein